jgi:hypothetical protein
MIRGRHDPTGVILVLGVVGVLAHVAASAGVSTTWQYVFGGASVAAALGIVAAGTTWVIGRWRSHFRAWDVAYTDADLIGTLDATPRIQVGEEADVFVRIRVNVFRPMAFEEIGVHLSNEYSSQAETALAVRSRLRPEHHERHKYH